MILFISPMSAGILIALLTDMYPWSILPDT